MSEGENKDYNIFIANQIYPDAEAIFTATPRKLEEIKGGCHVIVDTNALLVPYTTSTESLKEIRATYEKLVTERRLTIPGQVAREFAKNRATKIGELYKQLSDKRSVSQLQKGQYPLLESLTEYQDVLAIRSQRILHKDLRLADR